MIVSEEQLWMLETNFELAFQQILTRDGIVNVNVSREVRQEYTPSVDIEFIVGAATEQWRHVFPSDHNRRPPYSGWKGSTLTFTATTDRGSETANQHKVILAKIRKNCSIYKLLNLRVENGVTYGSGTWFDTEAGQFNGILDIRESGSSTNSLENNLDHDITRISFSLMHNLIDASWPSNI